MQTLTRFFEPIWIRLYHHKQTLIQIAVVLGVLLTAVVVAYKGSPSLLKLLLLPLPGLVGLAIVLRWPGVGLILSIVGGFFIQIAGPSGLNVTMLGIAFLLAAWIAKMLILDRHIQFIASRTIVPVLVLIVLAIISFAIGFLPFIPYAEGAPLDAQLGGLAIFILSASAFLITAHMIDIRWLERLTWVFVALGASYMVGRIVIALGVNLGRPFDPGATTNSMLFVWLVAITLSQAWFNNRLHWVFRAALLAILAATFFVAYGFDRDWKSGWVPAIIVVMAIIASRFWKPTIALLPFAAIAAISIAYALIGTDEYSWGTRVDAWLIVIEMSKASPIFGLGFSNYYWYSRFFPIRGYYVPFNSHSQYIDLLAQTGILGILCFFWIFGEVTASAWGLRHRAPEGFARAYTYGILGGVAGTLVAAGLVDWVLPFVYNIGFPGFRASVLAWIFMGGLVIVEQFTRQSTQLQSVEHYQGVSR